MTRQRSTTAMPFAALAATALVLVSTHQALSAVEVIDPPTATRVLYGSALFASATLLTGFAVWILTDSFTARRNRVARKTKYSFDSYRKSALTPFVLELEDRTITIPVPDGETVLEIEEAGSSRRRLELLCGEHFDEVFDLVRKEDPSVMLGLTEDMVEHFNLGGGRPPAGGRRS